MSNREEEVIWKHGFCRETDEWKVWEAFGRKFASENS